MFDLFCVIPLPGALLSPKQLALPASFVFPSLSSQGSSTSFPRSFNVKGSLKAYSSRLAFSRGSFRLIARGKVVLAIQLYLFRAPRRSSIYDKLQKAYNRKTGEEGCLEVGRKNVTLSSSADPAG
ncbi:hypothetical protein SCHPADRAFT_887680 [Schizopora paradoxa]|uniref:Uncharacterized protein n=1 Tax=Schizopora paradoxa TaxID=27342 RepID=A0A0H2RXY4_9AGAM|nr:hypothetical protein SCHPADRAFT_887680 [Schizopora paradoxa]